MEFIKIAVGIAILGFASILFVWAYKGYKGDL